MTYQPQVSWRNLAPHKGVLHEIDDAMAKLEERFGPPSSMRIVASPGKTGHGDHLAMNFKLEMHLQGQDFMVTHDHRSKDDSGSPVSGIRHAFEILKNQVTHNLDRRRDISR